MTSADGSGSKLLTASDLCMVLDRSSCCDTTEEGGETAFVGAVDTGASNTELVPP